MSTTSMKTTGARALVVAVALAVAAGLGCEREEYDPEAVSGDRQASESASDSHHYSVEVTGTELEVGQSATVDIEVLPSSDLWVNLDFPWSLEVVDAGGLEVETAELEGQDMDLREEKATIPIGLEALDEGEHEVRARGDISVCNDEICHTLRDQQVDFVVDAR